MSVLRKEQFILPEGVIYLDGNSLGPMPKVVPARLEGVLQDEWAQMLIRGWNQAGWMAQPSEVGDAVGRLIGAPAGSVVMGDTLSV
ncbi:MAG: kynureninase, partial [Pseudomonadota bacterium]